jgi:hypothetical protein
VDEPTRTSAYRSKKQQHNYAINPGKSSWENKKKRGSERTTSSSVIVDDTNGDTDHWRSLIFRSLSVEKTGGSR